MRIQKANGALVGAVLLFVLTVALPASAKTYSDQGAAILIVPKVVAAEGVADTLVQISSVNPDEQTYAHCIYVNSNSHCTNSGAVCTNSSQCVQDSTLGSCVPGWIEFNFDLVLTAEQPIAWSAMNGLRGADFTNTKTADDLANGNLPCPGLLFRGADCPNFDGLRQDQSNAGTNVPPVNESPFIGELKCIQTSKTDRQPATCSGTGADACKDYLTGSATIFRRANGVLDAAQYNAIGLKNAGTNNGDGVLEIGGATAEYQPCAKQLVLDHLFDGALDPIANAGKASTELTLVPCTQDFLRGDRKIVNALFLIYNEFEQRFSTTKAIDCQLNSVLSRIDTTQPTRSVFHAAVSGTIAGQTFIDTVGGGLVGVAVLSYDEVGLPIVGEGEQSPDSRTRVGSAAYGLIGMNGQNGASDTITIP